MGGERSHYIVIAAIAILAAFPLVKAGNDGAALSTDKPVYTYRPQDLQSGVHLAFTNTGSGGVFLTNSAPFRVLNDNGVVFEASGYADYVSVPPGHSFPGLWDYSSQCSQLSLHPCFGLATPGDYYVEWSYLDEGSTEHVVLASLLVKGDVI